MQNELNSGLTLPPKPTRAAAPASREIDTRDNAKQPEAWTPPGELPSPTPRQGIRFKWVRCVTRGITDKTNVHRHLHQKYEICTVEDVPELAYLVDMKVQGTGYETNTSGNIEFGGLLLMKIPEHLAEQRNAHYQAIHATQEEVIDARLMQHQDPRMPMSNNRKSSVKFGKNAQTAD
jgi:hypothetical protein